MEPTKLKSLRISEHTLSQIDDFVRKEHYYKSHAVMVAIIEHVFEYADHETILAIVRGWPLHGMDFHITAQWETVK